MNITRNLVAAVLMTVVTTVLFGVVYPLVITALAQAIFPDNGVPETWQSFTEKNRKFFENK